MVIGSQEGLRTAAKIAYVGLAHLVGVKVAAGDAFREVRQFIMEGRPKGAARALHQSALPGGVPARTAPALNCDSGAPR